MNDLPERMKAVVCHNPGDFRVEEVERPQAKQGEVVIKVKACGICGSDLKAYHGADQYWAGDDPWLKAPMIPGHEFYGEVVEVGEGVSDAEIGDLVTTDQIKPCGECRFCERGQYWMCEPHHIYGFQNDANGGMAEYMKFVSTSKIYQIPDSLSMEEASILEPMADAIHAVQRAEVELEDVVVLAGAGTLGLCMLQIIKLKTPKKLIVLDVIESRLELARKLGADLCLNPKEEDVVQTVKDLTNGYGCDVYIEATSSPAGVKQGLEMIRKKGTFVEFSVFAEKTSVDWGIIGDQKELDIRGAHISPYTYPIAIDLFARGLVSAEGIVTDIYSLTDFQEALKTAEGQEAIKVLLTP
ncbi:MAG: alcohol dehydrogenase catalytic domain-containing protein [Halanaerobiales bacterium]